MEKLAIFSFKVEVHCYFYPKEELCTFLEKWLNS